MQPATRPGFLSLEDAVALINSDSRSDAKVDTKWLVSHIDWIEEAHNFRIPLLKTTSDKRIVPCGSKYVEVTGGYEKETLKRTIRNHYRDMVGHEYDAPKVHAVSSVADDEVGTGVRPRRSKPIAKEGQAIGTGETITTNGANL
jgi:hypothetical protein